MVLFTCTINNHPGRTTPSVVISIVYSHGSLVIASSYHLDLAIMAAGASIHTVIISLEESPDLDGSSLEALHNFCKTILGNNDLFSVNIHQSKILRHAEHNTILHLFFVSFYERFVI